MLQYLGVVNLGIYILQAVFYKQSESNLFLFITKLLGVDFFGIFRFLEIRNINLIFTLSEMVHLGVVTLK